MIQSSKHTPYIGAEKGWKVLMDLKNLEGIMNGKFF
jgi:hypothetical protein